VGALEYSNIEIFNRIFKYSEIFYLDCSGPNLARLYALICKIEFNMLMYYWILIVVYFNSLIVVDLRT